MKNYGKEMKYMLNRNTQKIIHLLYYQEDVAKPIAEFVGLVC
jgi:DNA-directed RNA polymerase specialized sigma subunit